jgi:hypothetical protein
MEALLMRANLFLVVYGTKIGLSATNLALQVAWKNKVPKHNVNSY